MCVCVRVCMYIRIYIYYTNMYVCVVCIYSMIQYTYRMPGECMYVYIYIDTYVCASAHICCRHVYTL